LATAELVGHNLSFDLTMLRMEGLKVSRQLWDTMLASRLLVAGLDPKLEPESATNDLGSVIRRYLGIELAKGYGQSDWGQPGLSPEQLAYARDDVIHLAALKEVLQKELETAELGKVFELEMRLLPVLVDVKLAGIHIDRDRLSLLLLNAGAVETEACTKALELFAPSARYAEVLEFERSRHPKKNRAMISVPNLRSSQQLITLFEGLNITLPNTQEETLAKLRHPAADQVLAYLNAAGTKTRLAAMMALSDNKQSRIWAPDWGQLAPDTGRIHTASIPGQTSAKFNFQNPARGELREVFCAAPGCKLAIADFSQIEIRIIAEITCDPKLIRMLQEGVDIYVFVAATILGKKSHPRTRTQPGLR
jgi:DNA polymerase I-like protein with 3'-5' exonuclease and polymerase domains